MRRRGYLDLTPTELRARRVVFAGLTLFVLPPLLTLCHLHQFVCQATWDSGLTSFVVLAPLFPWVAGVALLMLGGLITALLGGVLYLFPAPRISLSC